MKNTCICAILLLSMFLRAEDTPIKTIATVNMTDPVNQSKDVVFTGYYRAVSAEGMSSYHGSNLPFVGGVADDGRAIFLQKTKKCYLLIIPHGMRIEASVSGSGSSHVGVIMVNSDKDIRRSDRGTFLNKITTSRQMAYYENFTKGETKVICALLPIGGDADVNYVLTFKVVKKV